MGTLLAVTALANKTSADLVQSVCREILANPDSVQFRSESAFRSWLYGAALDKIRNRLRYHRAERRDARRDDPLDSGSRMALQACYATRLDPSLDAARAEDVERVEASLAKLSERARMILALSVFAGRSHAEIGAELIRPMLWAPAMSARHYFYEIDRHGVLWHAGTALDDERFLAEFFARLRPDESGAHPDYPFVSACAGEQNHVRAAVTPIVFRRLNGQGELEAGGGVRVRFDPAALRIDGRGRLFHAAPVGGFGLLDLAAAMAVAAAIEPAGDGFVYVDGAHRIAIASCEGLVGPRNPVAGPGHDHRLVL